uniref:Uncharacterized protein n=1 Tax=Noccaea caerulescens TaxID=107243 RepID=A0A1J3G6U8_NOCCA
MIQMKSKRTRQVKKKRIINRTRKRQKPLTKLYKLKHQQEFVLLAKVNPVVCNIAHTTFSGSLTAFSVSLASASWFFSASCGLVGSEL